MYRAGCAQGISADRSIHNQNIGHHFPEVFDLKVRHIVSIGYSLDLAVTTVAGNNQYFGPGAPDLFHLFPRVMESFVFIGCQQGPAAAAAAILVASVGKKIDPMRGALIENPAGFRIITVAEELCGFTAVIAGIVVSDSLGNFSVVQPDLFRTDIIDQQIKYGKRSESIEKIRVPFLQPVPGCKIRMPSLRIHQICNLKFFHMFYNTAHKALHGLVIT